MTDETQGASPAEDAPVLPVDEQAADSSPAQTTDKADDAGPGKPRDDFGEKIQKRIDQLTWEKNERDREAAYWRQQALNPQPRAAEPQKPAEPATPPTLEQFGYDEAKYQRALIDYVDKQAEQVVERRLREADRERTEQQRMGTFAERAREFAKATSDFETRVNDPTLPISAAMRDVIVDSPTGPELAYYLAEHRDQAAQIARLPPHLAALELGRIDGRIAAQKEAAKRKSLTQAPPPPPKIDDADTPAGPKDPQEMSDDEWYRAQQRKRNLKQFQRK